MQRPRELMSDVFPPIGHTEQTESTFHLVCLLKEKVMCIICQLRVRDEKST